MAQIRRRLTYGFVAKATMVVIIVWALAQGLWLVRDILFVGFAGVLLAIFFSLLVDRLDAFIPRWLAGIVTLLVFLALIAGFWVIAWPQLHDQVDTIGEEVPRAISTAVEWAQDRWQEVRPELPAAVGPEGAEGAEGADGVEGAAGQVEETMQQRLQTEAMNMVAGALPLLNTVVGALAGMVVMIFTALFLVIDPSTYVRGFLHLVPEKTRPRLRSALEETGSTLKRWIAGLIVSMVVIFVSSTAGLYLLGVPGALVLGMIAGALVFIPFIGPILSSIPAMAMGLTVSPVMALWVALLYVGIELMESNFLTPLVMREAVELQPAATLLFQMAMGVLFGFLGLFLAVPLFAALQVIIKRLYVDPLEGSTGSAAAAAAD